MFFGVLHYFFNKDAMLQLSEIAYFHYGGNVFKRFSCAIVEKVLFVIPLRSEAHRA